jgi:hypothetical protein
VWLSCGEDIDMEALLPVAHQAGVSYRPGQAFSAARLFPLALHLSFALYVARCVEAMCQATTLPVTVKHCIGIDDLDRSKDNVLPGCGNAASASAPGGWKLR